MNTNPTVSRLVERAKITEQPNTRAKANEEGDSYNFSRISPGHYACTHGKNTYIIIDKDGKIGCSCDDMTYRCTDTTVCKHCTTFIDLEVPPQIPAPGELIKKLILMGWVGGKDDLHPPELLKPAQNGSENKADAPAEDMIHYECPKCGEVVDIEPNFLSDWKLDHLDICSGSNKTELRPPANANESTGVSEDTEDSAPISAPPMQNTPPLSNPPLIDNIRKYVGNDVLEVFGDTGSGKSKFALEVAREATTAGLKVFYLDSERNLTDEDVEMLGSGYKYTPVLKEIDDTIRKLPPVDIVIIDSIGFPILTAYARYSMKQKGDALLTMIAMFGDLKQWAYKNNGLVIVVNQPESTFNKEAGHILRPFGDKSQFAAKEIWWLKMVKRADKTPDHHTEIHISSFRGRTLGYGDKLYTMNIRTDGIEFVPMR